MVLRLLLRRLLVRPDLQTVTVYAVLLSLLLLEKKPDHDDDVDDNNKTYAEFLHPLSLNNANSIFSGSFNQVY